MLKIRLKTYLGSNKSHPERIIPKKPENIYLENYNPI